MRYFVGLIHVNDVRKITDAKKVITTNFSSKATATTNGKRAVVQTQLQQFSIQIKWQKPSHLLIMHLLDLRHAIIAIKFTLLNSKLRLRKWCKNKIEQAAK